MNVQDLPTGRKFVKYDEVSYQSPLWIVSNSETEIVYAEVPEGIPVGKVYLKDNDWYLSTSYLNHWQPVPTFSKYEGFLFLLTLKKRQEQ